MNKDVDIESFLRDNKPQIKDNPAFLLEVQQNMRAVEGIKAEVDRQKNHGRVALVCALAIGLLTGALAMLLVYLYPIDTETVSNGIISDIRMFIQQWKQYLMIPIAGCAIALGIIFGTRRQNLINI